MDDCTPLYIAIGLIVGFVIAQSRRSNYRSSTLSAYGSFPTRSKLLLG
jgi:hypothetical protein